MTLEKFKTENLDLYQRFLDLIKQEHLDKWLEKEAPAFENKKPVNLSRDELEEILYRLESGEPSL